VVGGVLRQRARRENKEMNNYEYEAMDATGQEIKGQVEAENQDDAQVKIRQMGYFVTKISQVVYFAKVQKPCFQGFVDH